MSLLKTEANIKVKPALGFFINNLIIENKKATEIVIEESANQITQKAYFTIPIRGSETFKQIEEFIRNKGTFDQFEIEIEYGYKYPIETKSFSFNYFTGRLINIEIINNELLRVDLEDFSTIFKKFKTDITSESITLEQLIKEIENQAPFNITKGSFPALNFNNLNFTLKNVKFSNITPMKIFEHLRKNYGINIFHDQGFKEIPNNVLFVGTPFKKWKGNRELNLEENFDSQRSDYQTSKEIYYTELPTSFIEKERGKGNNKRYYPIISKNLNYKTEEDVNFYLKINVIDNKSGDKNIYYYAKESGDIKLKDKDTVEGDKREIYLYGDYSKEQDQLFDIAEQELERIQYRGFTRGSSIVTFGAPKVHIYDILVFDGVGKRFLNSLDDKKLKKDDFRPVSGYVVESVKTTLSPSGGLRQEIEVGYQINRDYSDSSDSIVQNLSE